MNVNGWLVLEDESGAVSVDHRRPRRLDLNKVTRREDGSVIFNARPARTGDYEYLAFEVPQELTGAQDRFEVVTGRIEAEEMEKALPQFEGLIVTNDHCFAEVRNRADVDVGRVLSVGTLESDGFVTARTVITDAETIVAVEAGKSELSIGFSAVPVKNENRSKDSDPHFFWTNIKINHLAVVDAARAGPDARFTHSGPSMVPVFMAHRAPIIPQEKSMAKVKVGGVEYDADDALAGALEAERAAHTQAVTAKDTEIATLTNSVAEHTGTIAAHTATIATLQTEAEAAPDKIAEAVAAHGAFVDELTKLGEKPELSAGGYDATAEKAKVLTKHSIDLGEQAENPIAVNAAFSTLVASHGSKPGAVETAETRIQHGNVTRIPDFNERSAARYSGGKK